MGKIKKVIQWIPEVMPKVGLVPAFVALLFMIVLIFVGVALRYVFDSPLPFVDEYSGYALATLTLMTLAYALKTKGHIRVDIVVDRLPHRAASYLEIATLLVSLGFVIIILVATTRLTVESFEIGRLAWSPMETPLGPVQLVRPIGLSLFVIGIVAEIAGKIRSLRGIKEKG